MSSTIETQREKSSIRYKEALAPGIDIEMDLHQIFVATESKFQMVEIIETNYGKTLITDGKTQSSQFDEFVYHESLVHPAMLQAAQRIPMGVRSVFIGGGGELATAREVLRHKSVEKVVMVDLDGEVVDLCAEYLPEWGGKKVLGDPRLELVIGDAYAYLTETKNTFDVIIMDISDPIEAGPGIMLYVQEFYQHVKTLLNAGGVFVTQAGMAESVPFAIRKEGEIDPSCFAPIYNTLSTEFETVLPYSVHIPSFGCDWGFILATRQESQDVDQHLTIRSDIATIDSLIEQCITGGASALRHYDGVTHQSMIHLTKPLRTSLKLDQRTMTKDNPIFMY